MNPLRQRVRDVLAVPTLRRLVAAWGLSVVAETAVTVALIVVAYGVGGATWVAAFVAVRTVPALVVGPVLIGRSDRGSRERWLAGVLVIRLVLVILAAVSLALGAGTLGLVLGGLSSVLFTTHRPMNAALLPYVSGTPAQLTAANASSAFVEAGATLVGPALAGALLVVAPPTAVLGCSAVLLVVAAGTVRGVRDVPPSGSTAAPLTLLTAARDLHKGFASLRRPWFVLVLVVSQTAARGALLVAIAVLAVTVFDLGDPGVGWLSSMLGVGGLVGSLLAVVLVTSTRLARGFVGGILLWGMPMLVLGAVTEPVAGLLAFAVIGLGNAFVDVGVFTLVARLVPPHLMGRAFAAFEVAIVVGVTAGSWVAGVVIDRVRVQPLLVAAGSTLVVLSLLAVRDASRVDRSLEPSPHVEALRACRPLSSLPTVSIDHLAAVAEERTFEPGSVVIRQGDHGEEFFVVLAGSASVVVDGVLVGGLHAGDAFGDVALLRTTPRTATIVADETLSTLTLTRQDFLTFVVGHVASATALADLAVQREQGNSRRRAQISDGEGG
jgi:MFS family permease